MLTNFNDAHKTVFIIHGFNGKKEDNWIKLMKSALIQYVSKVDKLCAIILFPSFLCIVTVLCRESWDGLKHIICQTKCKETLRISQVLMEIVPFRYFHSGNYFDVFWKIVIL